MISQVWSFKSERVLPSWRSENRQTKPSLSLSLSLSLIHQTKLQTIAIESIEIAQLRDNTTTTFSDTLFQTSPLNIEEIRCCCFLDQEFIDKSRKNEVEIVFLFQYCFLDYYH